MRFAIVGDPVDHSLSPVIQQAGFDALGIDAEYTRLRVERGAFDRVVTMLRTGDLDGVNVTMPHKGDAFAAVDVRTDVAARTGAVNTITVRPDGALVGTNTDVAGVNHALSIIDTGASTPVLVLGGGGAAAAAVVACSSRPIFVATRRRDAAAAVLRTTATTGTYLHWGQGVAGAVVVNATPLGMHGESLPEPTLATASALIDMTYGSGITPACAWASEHGIPLADGLDMLLGQAYAAFETFTGQPAPREAMAASVAVSGG